MYVKSNLKFYVRYKYSINRREESFHEDVGGWGDLSWEKIIPVRGVVVYTSETLIQAHTAARLHTNDHIWVGVRLCVPHDQQSISYTQHFLLKMKIHLDNEYIADTWAIHTPIVSYYSIFMQIHSGPFKSNDIITIACTLLLWHPHYSLSSAGSWCWNHATLWLSEKKKMSLSDLCHAAFSGRLEVVHFNPTRSCCLPLISMSRGVDGCPEAPTKAVRLMSSTQRLVLDLCQANAEKA